MILDTKRKTLEGVKLSDREFRLLLTLLSNELVQPEAMFEFIFGRKAGYRPKVAHDLSIIKNRLNKKVKLNITNKYNIGYILKDNIYIGG